MVEGTKERMFESAEGLLFASGTIAFDGAHTTTCAQHLVHFPRSSPQGCDTCYIRALPQYRLLGRIWGPQGVSGLTVTSTCHCLAVTRPYIRMNGVTMTTVLHRSISASQLEEEVGGHS